MIVLPILLFSFLTLEIAAQDKYAGEYYNYFGSKLTLNADSSFRYSWNFDLSSSWSQGTWTVHDDTIYLKIEPVYDTLIVVKDGVTVADTLVLSLNDRAEVISSEEFAKSALTSGGQNKHSIPDKLYFSRKRLIQVDENGKLKKKKIRSFWSKKEYVPWYIKRKKK